MGGEVTFLNLSLFGCCCLFSCLHKDIFSRRCQVIVVTWPAWQAWLAERMLVTSLRRSLESQSSRGISTPWYRKWTRKWSIGTSWTLNLLMEYECWLFRGLLLINEKANENYNTEFISRYFPTQIIMCLQFPKICHWQDVLWRGSW